MRLPWKDVVKAAPIVLRAADRLLRRDIAALEHPGVATLPERVAKLESTSVAQAGVVEDIAIHTDQLARALRSLGVQVLIAIALAAAALGCAVVALIRTF